MTENSPDRILVVEDQGVSRMLLCHYLEENGYEVASAASCREALKLLEESRFNLVTVETLMEDSDMNGLELVSEIRSRFNQAELPVIVVSSMSEPSDRISAWNAGASCCIAKPAGEEETIAKVKLCLKTEAFYRKMQKQAEQYGLALKASNSGVFDWDLKNNTMEASARLYEILEQTPESGKQLSPKDWLDHIYPEDYSGVLGAIDDHLKGKTPFVEAQHRVLHSDGTHRWYSVRAVAVNDENGEAVRLVGNISDISSSLSYDNVTGLPGRHVFFDLLERAMVRAIRNEKCLFGILCVVVNETDKLAENLTQMEYEKIWSTVSRRLQLSSRASDLISRVDKDRFVILLDDLREVADALRVANRISSSLSSPLRIGENHVAINTSVGIAVSCDGYESPESMISDANKAAAIAQTMGENKTRMCNERHHKFSQERLGRESELYEAIAGKRFVPRFMPVVDASNRNIAGFEVLLRWRHSSGNLMVPDEFLDLCDRDQLILPIGYELVKSALEQVAKAAEISRLPGGFFISFNCEPRQFYDSDLLDNILLSCSDYNIDPSVICIEADASTFGRNIESARGIVERFADSGIRCIIDRFGSHPIPMTDLLTLKTAAIKTSYIDCTSANMDESRKMLLCRICDETAKVMGCRCIINGVENGEFSRKLSEAGMNLQEGFAFSQPVPVNNLEMWAERSYRL